MMRTTVVEINVVRNGGLLSPSDLPELVREVERAVPPAALQGLVVISGRLPIWAVCAIAHTLHPAAGIATYDPRLGGGVVVERHRADLPEVGTVVSLEGAEVVKVEF